MTHPTDALRLVPVEPTEAMQNAGVDAATNLFEGWVDEGQVSTLYRAMLAAAPDMMCCDNCGTVRGKADECDCSLHDGTPPVWVSAAPASPLPGGGWQDMTCDEQFAVATEIAANIGYVLQPEPDHPDCPHARQGMARILRDQLNDKSRRLRPLPAAPTGEPK